MQYMAFLIQYNSRTPLPLEQKRLFVRLHIKDICIGTFVKLMVISFVKYSISCLVFYINWDDLTYNNPNGVFSPWRKSYILHEMGRNCPSLQLLQSTEIPAKNLVCLSRSQRPSMLKFPTMSHAVVTSQIYLSSNIEDTFLSNVAIHTQHNLSTHHFLDGIGH